MVKTRIRGAETFLLVLLAATLLLYLPPVNAEEIDDTLDLYELDPVLIRRGHDTPVIRLPTELDYYLWEHHGGWWSDAEKTIDNIDDNKMCWAATCSNILEWSGWGYVVDPVNGPLLDSDAMFQNYNYYYRDQSNYVSYGFHWWFTGSRSGYVEIYPSGGYHPSVDYYDYNVFCLEDNIMIEKLAEFLREGYAVSLSLALIEGEHPRLARNSHAITCWGYRYGIYTPVDQKNHVVGIWVTDSDDNKDSYSWDPPPNALRYYQVYYDDAMEWWVVSDYHGGEWFISWVNGVRPDPDWIRPEVSLNTPYPGFEGKPVTFEGSGRGGQELLYRWDFTGDNQWDTQWSRSATATYTWEDAYNGTVLLQVFDGRLKNVAQVSVTILNAPPSVDAGGDREAYPGETISFAGSYTDPGAKDTHVIHWDFGDGAIAEDTLAPTHVYGEPGVYTVTLTVTDDDGGVGEDTLTVTVREISRYGIGETVSIIASTINTGQVNIVYSSGKITLTSEGGAYDGGMFESSQVIPPGETLYVPVTWDSTGAAPGVYDLRMVGEVRFVNGDTMDLLTLVENCFMLFEGETKEADPGAYSSSTGGGPETSSDKEKPPTSGALTLFLETLQKLLERLLRLFGG